MSESHDIEQIARAIHDAGFPEKARDAAWKDPVWKDCALGQARAVYPLIASAREEGAKWRDIDTAPKDGTYVLGCGAHQSRGHYVDAIHYYAGHWTIVWMDGYGEPTHWMPLPLPPVSA